MTSTSSHYQEILELGFELGSKACALDRTGRQRLWWETPGYGYREMGHLPGVLLLERVALSPNQLHFA